MKRIALTVLSLSLLSAVSHTEIKQVKWSNNTHPTSWTTDNTTEIVLTVTCDGYQNTFYGYTSSNLSRSRSSSILTTATDGTKTNRGQRRSSGPEVVTRTSLTTGEWATEQVPR